MTAHSKPTKYIFGLAVAALVALPNVVPTVASAEELPVTGSIVYGRIDQVAGGFTGGPQDLWVDIPSGADLDIFSRTVQDGEESAIAESSFQEDAPRWAPDGESVAYSSDESGFFQIYVKTPGEQPRQITSGPRDYFIPSWSPDGRSMVAMGCADAVCRIYRMHRNGSGVVAITRGPSDYFPEWSPDGKWILFTRHDPQEPYEAFHLYLVRPDGSFIKRISTGSLEGFSPRWSPDGKQIAFSASGPADGSGFVSTHIYVMDRDGSNHRRLTVDERVDDYYPCWSPDGSRVAFSRSRVIYRPLDPLGLYTYLYTAPDLYTVTLGGEVQQLTETPEISEALCDWA